MLAYALQWIFVVLHIITAAAWFGLGLRLAGRARTIASTDAIAGARALAEDGARSVRLMNIFVVLTLVFAVGAFLAGGGFASYGPQYHTSLLLIVVLTGLQFFVIRRGWADLRTALSGEKEDAPEASVESARRRIAMGTGIGHLTWLVLLALMFWNEFAVLFQG